MYICIQYYMYSVGKKGEEDKGVSNLAKMIFLFFLFYFNPTSVSFFLE